LTWNFDQKLTASDPGSLDQFGNSVAIAGDTIVIGAAAANDPGAGYYDSGAAYVFMDTPTGWQQIEKLTAGGVAASYAFFGDSVSVNGDLLVVGADRDDNACGAAGGSNCGAAYVFRRNGASWDQEGAPLIPEDAHGGQMFGSSVSVSGESIIVGAPYDGHAGTDSGSAYLFMLQGSDWVELTKVIATDAAGGDRFGTSVAMDGPQNVAGAPGDNPDSGVGRSGSAYVAADCNGNGILDVCEVPPIDPEGADCNENGVPDDCETDCQGNGVPDECEVPPIDPDGPDCNGNGIPDECDPDSDRDGVINDCDNCPGHANADQADCDDDGTGDICAISTGQSDDCNANWIPDACEIADGTVDDCQDDGIPDECQLTKKRRVVIDEGFEGDPAAPDWLTIADAPNGPWGILDDPDYVYSGTQAAFHPWSDEDYADSYLLTPELNLVTGSLSVWTLGCFGGVWCDSYHIDVMIVVGLPGGDDDIFVGNLNELYVNYYATWENASYDLTPLLPGGNFHIGFRYYGLGGDIGLIDNVWIDGESNNDCNANEIPDDCDIARGPSTDDNGNGIPDECECPEVVVVFSDPPDGVIDARQPYPPDDAGTRQGIDAIVVSGPEGAANLGCWTTCESASAGSPIEIAGVLDHGDGTFTLSLNRPITPGAVTTVTYTTSTGIVQSGRFTSHPANSDGSSESDSADIVALVACCLNRTCAWEPTEYACNIDRSSGTALHERVTAADVLRVIDLLNGADQYDRWEGVPLPDCGSCCP
jgi:hypothetical protein